MEGCPQFPARPYDVALFYTILMTWCDGRGFTHSPLLLAADAISYVHGHRDVPSPARAPVAAAVLEAAKRRLSRPRRKARPLTRDTLALLEARFADESDIGWFTIYTIIVVGYAGMFRYDDMVNIDLAASRVLEDRAMLFVATRKSDKYYHGLWVAIAAVGGKGCPVRNLRRWMRLSRCSEGSFCRAVSRGKDGTCMREQGLSYGRFRELMRVAFVMAGMEEEEAAQFGTRCLRTGAATAALEHGVEDRLVMRHGGWKSRDVMLGYVQDSVEQQLRVSRALFC